MQHAFHLCLAAVLGVLTTIHGNVIIYTQELPQTIAEEFLDVPASFGPELPAEGLRALLVAGEPRDGCSALTKPPLYDNFTGKWVVLIARYNCSFEVKVRNAQEAGFDCAIVHNVNSSELETMSAKDPDTITIPSVFVSDLAGIILEEEYVYTNHYFIMINGDIPFNINTHLLLPFAIVVVLCLIVILIFMIVKCIKDRRRARRHRLPNRSLKKIPTCKFSKGDPYDTCAICLDDYQEGERLRVLPCAHAYHAKCIDPWLTENRRVCPVCKRRVLAADERPHDLDSDDTEPLLDRGNDTQVTNGGTFQEQRENPFVRAARYIYGLRGRNETGDPEIARPTEESNANSENNAVDTAPLLASAEPGRRRGRRSRRQRSALRRVPQQQQQQQPPPASVTRSVNDDSTDEDGEIVVAALPAQSSEPHYIGL